MNFWRQTLKTVYQQRLPEINLRNNTVLPRTSLEIIPSYEGKVAARELELSRIGRNWCAPFKTLVDVIRGISNPARRFEQDVGNGVIDNSLRWMVSL